MKLSQYCRLLLFGAILGEYFRQVFSLRILCSLVQTYIWIIREVVSDVLMTDVVWK